MNHHLSSLPADRAGTYSQACRRGFPPSQASGSHRDTPGARPVWRFVAQGHALGMPFASCLAPGNQTPFWKRPPVHVVIETSVLGNACRCISLRPPDWPPERPRTTFLAPDMPSPCFQRVQPQDDLSTYTWQSVSDVSTLSQPLMIARRMRTNGPSRKKITSEHTSNILSLRAFCRLKRRFTRRTAMSQGLVLIIVRACVAEIELCGLVELAREVTSFRRGAPGWQCPPHWSRE